MRCGGDADHSRQAQKSPLTCQKTLVPPAVSDSGHSWQLSRDIVDTSASQGRPAMSKAQLVIAAVVLEGRSKSEVARDYDVSRQWVQQLSQTLRSRRRCGLHLARSRRPALQPSSRHRRGRGPHRAATQDTDQTRSGRRRRHHRLPSGRRSRHHECACRLDNLANLKAPWLRHTPTAQTAPLLLETLLRRTAQPMLASRRHPLAPRGQLIRKLVLDPTRDYQPRGVKYGNSPEKQAIGVNHVPGHLSTMSRDTTPVPPAGFEPAAFCSGGRRSIP